MDDSRGLLRTCLAKQRKGLIKLGDGRFAYLHNASNKPYTVFADLTANAGASSSQILGELEELHTRLSAHVPFFPPISAQDQEILVPLLQGASAAEIANNLRLQRGQVNSRLRRIYRIFGVSKREELMVCLWQSYRKNKTRLLQSAVLEKMIMPAFLVASLFPTFPTPSFATDQGEDLPFLHRYPDSLLSSYQHRQFDEIRIPTGPFDEKGEPSRAENLQGEVVYIEYHNPSDRSPLEIMSNYQKTLQQEGFQILWQCTNNACNTKHDIGKVFQYNPIWQPAESFSTYFYGNGGGKMSTARLVSLNGTQTWVYIWMSGSSPIGRGETYIYAVQTKPMQMGMVTGDRELVTAGEMDQALRQQGRFAMHIPFDYNKATLRPDAQAPIIQLAQVLKQNRGMMVGLDGHTDAIGSAGFNQNLSEERAQAVKVALEHLGVPGKQIATRGLGATQPIADNQSDAGRAKNRRVEVVNLTPGFVPRTLPTMPMPTAAAAPAAGVPAMTLPAATARLSNNESAAPAIAANPAAQAAMHAAQNGLRASGQWGIARVLDFLPGQ